MPQVRKTSDRCGGKITVGTDPLSSQRSHGSAAPAEDSVFHAEPSILVENEAANSLFCASNIVPYENQQLGGIFGQRQQQVPRP